MKQEIARFLTHIALNILTKIQNEHLQGICFDNWDLRDSFKKTAILLQCQVYCKTDPVNIQKNTILLKIGKENNDGVDNILILVNLIYCKPQNSYPDSLTAGTVDEEKNMYK